MTDFHEYSNPDKYLNHNHEGYIWSGYSARVVHQQKAGLRSNLSTDAKLLPGNERFEWVIHRLREPLSPDQTADKLAAQNSQFQRHVRLSQDDL